MPTRHDYPECSNQYREFRQSQTNRPSIHAQDVYHHNNMDRRLKNKSVHDRLGKRVVDQDWADYEEEGNERKICLAGRPMVSWRFDKKLEEKGATLKE